MATKNANLNHTLTVEEQRLGGIRSGETRRKRKLLREELDALLSRKDLQKDMCQALISKALAGDIRAFEIVRDTLGESFKRTDSSLLSGETFECIKVSLDPDNQFEIDRKRQQEKLALESENALQREKLTDLENELRELTDKLENTQEQLKKEQKKREHQDLTILVIKGLRRIKK